MVITILGKRWRLRFCRIKDDGECDPPDKPGKEIRINSRLRGRDRLTVLIHEMLHGASWHHSEEWVDETSQDIAKILWRLGYRENGK